VYDTMRYIKPDIATICVGQAASMAAILLAAGTPGKRSVLKNSRVMIHQPWGGVEGQASDIEIHAKEILGMKKKLNQILSDLTGQDVDKVAKDTDRNYFMDATESKDYGLVDQILTKRKTDEQSK